MKSEGGRKWKLEVEVGSWKAEGGSMKVEGGNNG